MSREPAHRAAASARFAGVRRKLLTSLAAGALVLAGAATSASAAEPAYEGSPIFQDSGACPAYGDQQICSGEVASFDGTLLDTDLTRPAQGTGGSHPLIVMLHGFGGTKHEWESATNAGDGGDKAEWNSHWFSQHGYYVLTYTARGFVDPGPDASYQPPTPGGSSGRPASGPRATIHLKSRDTEIEDTQWLAALVADSFPDVDPSRVAVTGGSYGGGESWLQASQAEWTFPHDCSNPDAGARPAECQGAAAFSRALPVLQLQVAVPKYPWTDLAYSLAPNGHPGSGAGDARPAGYCDVDPSLADDPCYSSSQGDPGDDTGAGNPFGVVKSGYTGLFLGYGHGVSNGTGFQEEDPCDTPPAPASVDSWALFADGTGEPYDVAGAETPVAAQVRHALTECRASYYQDEGWKAQASGPRRVAIFSIQGWTDDLFTPVESFREFKYLKRLDPTWPVALALADVGHPRAKNNPDTWHFLNRKAWQFLQAQIPGSHDQQTNVMSQQTACGPSTTPDPNQTMTGRTPEDLSSGALSITFATGGSTRFADPDPNAPADDPLLDYAGGQIVPGRDVNCPPSPGPAPYTAVSPPLAGARTYIGLGSVTVPYRLTEGTTAQLDARLWVVPRGSDQRPSGSPDCVSNTPPPGCPLLITRGTYRIDVPAYDSPAGTLRIPFFGNHYRLQPGDRLRLDLTQDDAPYLRLSNAPSAIEFDAPTLTLPTRESGTDTLTASP
jgi:dienelactone hydrolase